VPGRLWQWQMGLVLLPTIAYGLILFKQKFPVQERVAAKHALADLSLKEMAEGVLAKSTSLLLMGRGYQ